MAGEDTTNKLRVHVQESAGSIDVFRIDRAKFLKVFAEHRDLEDRIELTFGDNGEQLEHSIGSAEVLVVGNVNAGDLRRRAPHLRWIQTIFAGVEKLAPQVRRDIILTNASGVHAPKAAEFAIGAIIMLNCEVPRFIDNMREQKWAQAFTSCLAGRTVVILGAGAMGSAVAERARSFAMNVIGIARSAGPRPYIDECHDTSKLSVVFPKADFLVITLPNTKETFRLVGRRELDLLPNHAGVVSIGRAQVLDHNALVEKLAKNELSGAFLDVFEEEPLPKESVLWRTPRLIVMPHCVVDDSRTYVQRSLAVFFDNLRRYLNGDALKNVIDLELGY